MGKYKKHEQSIANYTKAIELDKHDIVSYYQRALLYDELKDYDNAQADFLQITQLVSVGDQYYEAAMYHLGNLYYKKELFRYDKVIESDGTDINAYISRSALYENLKDYEKAILDYNKIIELNEKDASAYECRAALYQKQGNYKKAIADYDKVIALDGKNTEAYNTKAHLHEKLEEFEKAIDSYNNFIEILNESSLENVEVLSVAYFNRAKVYKELKDNLRFQADYEKAIKLDPTLSNLGI
ncbi:tetratricopeptide repeat protein [Cytobacillus sp. IB215316]|uniref:tetratricopeptide repeat protein n=1 Tax=Cytobacillus sp. IB215316 TaxID=3097354 RepID=UPI002A106DB5|nr:tetratricopeptide repeat protein [Cytobacillus sp. IB215316]MDX8363446.1 tetratricopeptide repeat protein [Cytobacillus sp. IB215316]